MKRHGADVLWKGGTHEKNEGEITERWNEGDTGGRIETDIFTYKHAHTYKHALHTIVFLHKDCITHRCFYIQTLYTQTLLHTETLLHIKPFWHTDSLTHKQFSTHLLGTIPFYTQTLLHADAFAHRRFYTQTRLHTDTNTLAERRCSGLAAHMILTWLSLGQCYLAMLLSNPTHEEVECQWRSSLVNQQPAVLSCCLHMVDPSSCSLVKLEQTDGWLFGNPT